MPDLSFEEVADLLHSAHWIFAKTMPENPHEYTLRREWQDQGLFSSVVAFIRSHGYRHKFGGRWYMQLDVDEHFYWTMGAPIPKTILINRKVKADPVHELEPNTTRRSRAMQHTTPDELPCMACRGHHNPDDLSCVI